MCGARRALSQKRWFFPQPILLIEKGRFSYTGSIKRVQPITHYGSKRAHLYVKALWGAVASVLALLAVRPLLASSRLAPTHTQSCAALPRQPRLPRECPCLHRVLPSVVLVCLPSRTFLTEKRGSAPRRRIRASRARPRLTDRGQCWPQTGCSVATGQRDCRRPSRRCLRPCVGALMQRRVPRGQDPTPSAPNSSSAAS